MRTLKTRSKSALVAVAAAAAVVGGTGVANAYSSDTGDPSGASDWLYVAAGNYYSWNQNFGEVCNDQSSGNSFNIRVLDPRGNVTHYKSGAWINAGQCVGITGTAELWFTIDTNHAGFDIQVISNGRVVAESGYANPS